MLELLQNNYSTNLLTFISTATPARGAMVMLLEQLIVKQGDMGSIPGRSKCLISPWVWGCKNELNPDTPSTASLEVSAWGKICYNAPLC